MLSNLRCFKIPSSFLVVSQWNHHVQCEEVTHSCIQSTRLTDHIHIFLTHYLGVSKKSMDSWLHQRHFVFINWYCANLRSVIHLLARIPLPVVTTISQKARCIGVSWLSSRREGVHEILLIAHTRVRAGTHAHTHTYGLCMYRIWTCKP